jgi:hypothetical protein
MKRILLLGLACAALPCLGQAPPPNDNFSNRTVLTGSSFTFSGTLAGATVEAYEPTWEFLGYPNQSVWWTWTAPQTSLVTLEMVGASADSAAASGFQEDGLAVYDTTNIFGPINPSQPIAQMGLDLSILCDAVTFSAVAGSNYQFQLQGSSSTAYQFLLIATNAPRILQQPRSVTVSSNASTLFTVVAEGYRPFSYQWQFAGTNLEGQTVAMLALTNIDGSQAGSYSVVVTNLGGAVTSAPAVLLVSTSNVAPVLTSISGQFGQFMFGLTGEVGRNYRIESSADLNDWTNEYRFSRTVYVSPATSVVFDTNGSSVFAISDGGSRKFLQASRYQPADEICVNNLRQIRFAKALLQRDSRSFRESVPVWIDIAPYFLNGIGPYCPLSPFTNFAYSYFPGALGTVPVCNIDPTHVLEEPQ